MNKFICILFKICILSATTISAQNLESGVFAAPVLKYTRLVNQPALIIGVKGCWIISKQLVLGAGYYALTSDVKSNYFDTQNNQDVLLNFNYGGLEFEYLLFNDPLFNLSLGMLTAGGGIEYYVPNRSKNYPYTNLLVWEPQINFEVKIFEWLHADTGLSYRIISDIYRLFNVTKNDMQGINILLTFKIGEY